MTIGFRVSAKIVGMPLAAALLCGMSAAYAQSSTASADAGSSPVPLELQQVIVTAQFVRQTAQSTPIAMTAISAQQLQARGQTSLAQVAAEVPNTTLLLDNAHGVGPTMVAYMRGVGEGDFSYAFEPGVGVYIDGVYYSTITGSDFDLLDLDNVVVLRGPQGTLAGMNSEGGAIELFTKKPDASGDGYLEATYGSYRLAAANGAADFVLVPDKLFMRFSGFARHQNGYVTRLDYGCVHPGAVVAYSATQGSGCTLGTEGGVSKDGVRDELRWLPTDKLEINLSADVTDDSSEAAPQTLLYIGQSDGQPGTTSTRYPQYATAPAGGVAYANAQGSPFITSSPFGPYAEDNAVHSPYATYATFCDPAPADHTGPWCASPVNEVSSYGSAGTIDYQINDQLSVKSITSWRRYNAQWGYENSGAPAVGDGVQEDTVWNREFSQELRLSGKLLHDAVNWTLGGIYFDQISHYGGRIDLGTLEFMENDRIPANWKAGYFNVGWNITHKLQLNAGVRYTQEVKTFEYGRLGVPGTPAGGLYEPCPRAGGTVVSVLVCGLNGTASAFRGGHTDYRVALQYQWTDALMTYATISTGFKGGGVNPRPYFSSQAYPFKPETLTNYEIGMKSDWLDHRIRANVDAFWDKYTDIQLGVVNCGFIPGIPASQVTPCLATLNAGDAVIEGTEFDLTARPIGALLLSASGSYLDFRYTSLSRYAAGAGVTPDTWPDFTPKWKGTVSAQYTLPVGGAGTLTPRVDLNYQGKMGQNTANLYGETPSYTVLNAHLIYEPNDAKWQIRLEGTNLANRLYYLDYNDERSATGGPVFGVPAPPREFSISVRRSW